jgi:hypothetical protein
MGILYTKRHAAGGRAMFLGKIECQAAGFAIDDEVNIALAVQHHILGAMLGDRREAHQFESGLKDTRLGRSKFDELEAIKAHGVFEQVSHQEYPRLQMVKYASKLCAKKQEKVFEMRPKSRKSGKNVS